MRETVAATVTLFIVFLLLGMPFLGNEALYLAFIGAIFPQALRIVRGDWWGSSQNPTDESDNSSFWDSIPVEQYTGRFAEAGGIARKEQEEALNDIQGQAQVEEQHNHYSK